MTWLAWRQLRASAIVVAVTLVAITVGLAATPASGTGYLSHDHLLKFFSTFLVGVPALIGAFWGAPLITTELEAGTHRLVWTQSVTRTRWLAVKLGIVGLAAVAFAGLLSLVLGAASSDLLAQERFGSAMFAQRGIVPIGYAAFGLALGLTIGLLLRRTIPAMATTLVAFVAVRVLVQNLARPHFATAITISGSMSPGEGAREQVGDRAPAGAWEVTHDLLDRSGHVVNNIRCGPDAGECMRGFHEVLTYQPASRYWAFQAYETAIFLVLTVVLFVLCFRWIRTRLS
jgi:hypothetical protein